jgi:hypothetical protein
MLATPGQNSNAVYKSFRLQQNWAGRPRPKLTRKQLAGAAGLPELHHVREHLELGGRLPSVLSVKHLVRGGATPTLSTLKQELAQ